MKNLDLITINNLLRSTDFNNIANGKFQYAIQMNISKLESEVKILNASIEKLKHPEYITINNEGMIWKEANPGKPDSDWEKYKEFEKEAVQFKKLVDEFLEIENTFEFFKIPEALIESIALNQQQMIAIFKLIET